MKTISRIAVTSCAMSLFVSSSSFADSATNQLPTIAEIDAEIACLANQYGAKTLWREFVPTVGRIKDLQDKFPTQEVLQVQWHVVSNMFSECYPVATVTNSNQVNYNGINDAIWLHLTKYKLFHVDTNALMFVANCVSNVLPIDVSHEEEETLAAWRQDDIADFGNTNGPLRLRQGMNYHCYGDRTYACIEKYRIWRGFNGRGEGFRRRVLNSFCELMLHDLSEYSEPTRRSLLEEFCRRAGASNKEKAEAHRDLYDDFKIVYP